MSLRPAWSTYLLHQVLNRGPSYALLLSLNPILSFHISSQESFVGEASNSDLNQLMSLNPDLVEMDSLPLQGHLTRDMLTVAVELEAFLPIACAGSGGWGAEEPWLDSWEPAGFALTHVLP